MPGLLKIGCTYRSPEERRRELSRSTGVPVDFVIEYEIYSIDIEFVERATHMALTKYQFGKEFFKVDLLLAIEILRKKVEESRLENELKSSGVNELFEAYEAVEILGLLQKKYSNMIRQEIKSVRIYQTKLRCFLEILEEEDLFEKELVDQKIHRMDSAFIVDSPEKLDEPDPLLFDPSRKVTENARIFIEELDSYSIHMCTNLFTKEAGKTVNAAFLSSRNRI